MTKKGADIEFLEKVALKIKRLREAKGASQQVAYEDTGINFGRIESTPQDLSVTTLRKLCSYFDLTIAEFFKGL